MDHPEVVHDAVLPLTWIPTRGNDIPPHAVPVSQGPSGQLYIARGLLGNEMHIGTTSYSSTQGAQLRDRYGRSHTVFEYEVLTCASSLRFQLEAPQALTPLSLTESTETTTWSHVRRESVSPVRTATPPPKKTGKLEAFPWLTPRGQPAIVHKEPAPTKHHVDPPPYTSPIGGHWIEVPKQPRPIALSRQEGVQFKHLAQSKCFALIDDTPSMQYSWSQTRAALAGVVDILSSDVRWDGLNVRFIHHAQTRPYVKTREEFEDIFNSVVMWRGEKSMATKVDQVFSESLPLVHETRTPRPVVLLIVTDGMATDTQELFDVIVRFCHKLDERNVAAHMFHIHILQVGEDRRAVKPLHDFRDRVAQRDHDRGILNVVSFHRGRGLLNAQHITKLLLASTDIPNDEDPDLAAERLPSEVVAAQYQGLERIRLMGSDM